MDVSIEGLFDRLVKRRMGSYCFGQNGLLLEMLRGLGFRCVHRTFYWQSETQILNTGPMEPTGAPMYHGPGVK